MTAPVAVHVPSGCRLDVFTEEDLADHVTRIADLRTRATGVSSRPGTVTVSFDLPADDERLIAFVASERRCCGFLSITLGADVNGATVIYASDDPEAREALFEAARLFDPAGPATSSVKVTGRSVSKAVGPIGLIGVACGAACALPLLVTAGGLGAIGGGLAGVGWIAVAVGVAALIVGVEWYRRRRVAISAAGCGCAPPHPGS